MNGTSPKGTGYATPCEFGVRVQKSLDEIERIRLRILIQHEKAKAGLARLGSLACGGCDGL